MFGAKVEGSEWVSRTLMTSPNPCREANVKRWMFLTSGPARCLRSPRESTPHSSGASASEWGDYRRRWAGEVSRLAALEAANLRWDSDCGLFGLDNRQRLRTAFRLSPQVEEWVKLGNDGLVLWHNVLRSKATSARSLWIYRDSSRWVRPSVGGIFRPGGFSPGASFRDSFVYLYHRAWPHEYKRRPP